MQYRWDDFSLDREGALLMRQGQQVDTSRKVLDCITHLVEHRQRVVSYDELIREVWGHENVTNNQLSQVILAARRALCDDGQAQRLIRTMPGLGYRWVGALCETTPADTALQAQAPELPVLMQVNVTASMPDTPLPAQANPAAPVSSSVSGPRMTAAPWYRHQPLRIAVAAVLALATVAAVGWQWRRIEPAAVAAQPVITTPTLTASPTAAGPLAGLEESFWRGKYEEVRAGLAALPADLADSPDARLLDIRLDVERGRFDRAAQKLALQQAKAKAAVDAVWQAKLFARQSFLSGSAGKAAPDILAPAKLAVDLLESAGQAVPPQVMGEALSARGYGLMKANQLEPAVRDLVRARALLLKGGDTHGAANAADTLARVQMRMGRLADALALMLEIANLCEQSNNPVQEIYARNGATKIQVELLRWRDALASSDRSMQLLQAVPDSERRARVVQLRALVLTGMGRLREADSLIEEGYAMRDERYSSIITATYHLVSGRTEQALAAAAEAQAFTRYSTNDSLNLESSEGALLLWMIAAQDLTTNGKAVPMPSLTQHQALRQPESDISHIVRGRWLWSQGNLQDAQTQFRLALAQARQMGHVSVMLRASEPLIELLLQHGDTKAAEQVLAELQGYDPPRMEQDYRANLLGLRVALALGQKADIVAAYSRTVALAGERALPAQVLIAYKDGIRSPGDLKNVRDTASRL